MTRDKLLTRLKHAKAVLAVRFGVKRLALFGSFARGEAREDSDVDLLVSFDAPATAQRYFGVQFYLEDELGLTIDLVTEKAIRKELKPFVERDLIDV